MNAIHFDQLFLFLLKISVIFLIAFLIFKARKNIYTNKISKAIQFHNEGNYEKSLKFLNKHLAMNPDDFSAYLLRGECHYHLYEYELSETDFKNALELSVDCSKCHYYLALLAIGRKEFELSIEHFTESIKIDPENHILFFNRGLAYFYYNDSQKSIADFEKALSMDSTEEEFIQPYIGYSQYLLNDYHKADAAFQRAIELNKNNINAYKYRGLMNFSIAKYKECISDLETAIFLNKELEEDLNPFLYEAKGKLN